MIVQVIRMEYPYNKVGQILTVAEKLGIQLIKKTKKNHYKPIAKKLTLQEAEKIEAKQRKDKEKAYNDLQPVPVKFLEDVFPYQTGEIVTLHRDHIEDLIEECKVEMVKVEKLKKTESK